MSIKSKLERAYSSIMPAKVQEFLAPKSDIEQIQQGQKYSQTKFRHPETSETLDYTQMFEYYTTNNLACSELERFIIKITKDPFPSSFEEFADPYIRKYETGSTEVLMEGMLKIRSTLLEYGIDLDRLEDRPIQDALDNCPNDLDIFHN
jgi:hypothetical protein